MYNSVMMPEARGQYRVKLLGKNEIHSFEVIKFWLLKETSKSVGISGNGGEHPNFLA